MCQPVSENIGPRGFSVVGPSTWNSLPMSLHDQSLTLTSFCHQLKTFLCSRAYASSALSWLLIFCYSRWTQLHHTYIHTYIHTTSHGWNLTQQCCMQVIWRGMTSVTYAICAIWDAHNHSAARPCNNWWWSHCQQYTFPIMVSSGYSARSGRIKSLQN